MLGVSTGLCFLSHFLCLLGGFPGVFLGYGGVRVCVGTKVIEREVWCVVFAPIRHGFKVVLVNLVPRVYDRSAFSKKASSDGLWRYNLAT